MGATERYLDLDPDDDPRAAKYDGERVDRVREVGPVYLVDIKGDTIIVAEHEIVNREVATDGGESTGDIERLKQARLATGDGEKAEAIKLITEVIDNLEDRSADTGGEMPEPEHTVSAKDTPEGCDWQVVEVTTVGQSTLGYDRIRYGLTREQAVEKASEAPSWKAIPMPDARSMDSGGER